MGTIIGNIFRSIARLFNKLKSEVKKLVPIAINIVEGIKSVMDSPVDDILATIIKNAIPGDADDILIDKITKVVKEWIPKVLIELKMVESVAGIDDQNEQLKAILSQFKLSSDETQNIFYHGLCSLILEKLSDGKLSWSDSIIISEYYFRNVAKKNEQ